VNEQEAGAFSDQNNMSDFIVTSAKTGDNVEKAFSNLIKIILDKITSSGV